MFASVANPLIVRSAPPGTGRDTDGVTEERIELVRRGFEVYNEAGPSAFIDYMIRVDLLHGDFLFHIQEDLPNGGDWVGIDGFNRMTELWLEAWEEFDVDPHEFMPVGEDGILIPVRQRATARGSGMEVEGEFVYVVLFRDGKVEQMHLYGDREQAERAARPDPGDSRADRAR